MKRANPGGTDVITNSDFSMLAKLAVRVQAAPELSEEDIKRVQRLVTMGLARDFSAFHGTRTPVRLRIWGITSAGKAVLEQKSFTDAREPRRLNFLKDQE